MNNILISIVIPAYNIEKYIERCLDSVLNQTYKNLEIIVVNDGSTDNTGTILDEYSKQDSRICVIHKDNGGVSSARIMGVEKSSGEFIGFVDGDDYVEPEMFEHLLGNALKYNADISHCGYQMVFPDGHVDLYYGTEELVEQNHDAGLTDLIKGEFVEPGLWNKLYRRELVKDFYKSSLWDSTIKINEDLLMNYILFSKANHSIYEDIPYYHYVLRKGSAATSSTKDHKYKVTDPLKVMDIIKGSVKPCCALYQVLYCRYLRTLINVAMQKYWEKEAFVAQKKLRRELMEIEFHANCRSIKMKFMVIGVAYFKVLYKAIRFLYELFTGVSKKYEII